MKLAITRERRAHERRVAATPDTVKRLKGLGLDIVVESGAQTMKALTQRIERELLLRQIDDEQPSRSSSSVDV